MVQIFENNHLPVTMTWRGFGSLWPQVLAAGEQPPDWPENHSACKFNQFSKDDGSYPFLTWSTLSIPTSQDLGFFEDLYTPAKNRFIHPKPLDGPIADP